MSSFPVPGYVVRRELIERRGTVRSVKHGKDGLVAVRVKIDGRLVTFKGLSATLKPRQWQMLQWGQAAVESIKARVAKGVGSDDAPMPQLKQSKRARFSKKQQKMVTFGQPSGRYARFKIWKGLKPIRDLTGTGEDGGHMLDAFRVTQVRDNKVTLDVSTAKGRVKARANEQRAPWFGLSGGDVRNVVKAAQRIFKVNIDELKGRINTGATRKGFSVAMPIWMDPYGVLANQGGAVRNLPASQRARFGGRLAT